jgi:hypothetical protein
MDPCPIPFILLSHVNLLALFTFSHTAIAFHSICSFLYFKQTGEINNLIVSWEQSTWFCCVQVPRCSWQSKALDEAPYKVSRAIAKLASIAFLSLAFSWIRLNLGFLLRENSLLYSSNLPLGVPDWTVIYTITHRHSKEFFGTIAEEKEDFCS